jgi:hypothetical protein
MSPTEFVRFLSSSDFEAEITDTDLTYTYNDYTMDTNFTPVTGSRIDWV